MKDALLWIGEALYPEVKRSPLQINRGEALRRNLRQGCGWFPSSVLKTGTQAIHAAANNIG